MILDEITITRETSRQRSQDRSRSEHQNRRQRSNDESRSIPGTSRQDPVLGPSNAGAPTEQGQVMSLREALLGLDPIAVQRSDEMMHQRQTVIGNNSEQRR